MKVKDVLFFVLGVIAMLGVLMLVFPEDGIQISKNFTLYFPGFKEMFLPKEELKIDSDSLIKSSVEFDVIDFDNDTIDENINIDEIRKKITVLEFPEGKTDVLDNFFEKLSQHTETDRIRIIHYGDSQIEGDRITCDLRNKLQSKFGGTGPGLLLPVTIYSQFSIIQSNSDNWTRYTGFGNIDTLIKHRKYGPMISFSRFAPVTDSLWQRPENTYSAWLEFSKSYLAYSNTTLFRNAHIYYGNCKEKIKITVFSDNEIIAVDSLKDGDGLHVFKYSSEHYLDNIRFEFEGYDSPDFYAVSLEDSFGIYVDNIALRGSSGDVFSSSDGNLLSQSFNYLATDLFILQFGGNTVPYIKDEKGAKQFANYFKHHVAYLKNIVPDASFIVIGPSDMSVKMKDSYKTSPNLDTIINEMRLVTHELGIVYWDSYKAMGGKNSMPKWVNAEPPLASPDYVHFTPQGANVIANMFYNALILEYQSYLKNK